MHEEQLLKLKELMELCFCTLEMTLFLDTHPNDERAIGLHNTYAAKYRELSDEYDMKFGPLTADALSKNPWEWTEGPWPWDTEYINCCK
ncbi:MAG: spore coat protein CotJB [Vallitaleaceae bacterium]|nr:spore coat protein CotJB [Vallitaleaceae bacterium]